MQQVGNEGQREVIQGTGFQERKQNNVHHQGQQRQHIPGKKTVGKGVRIKGTKDPIHNGRRKGCDRDIQGEIKREKHPPRYLTDHILLLTRYTFVTMVMKSVKEEKQ